MNADASMGDKIEQQENSFYIEVWLLTKREFVYDEKQTRMMSCVERGSAATVPLNAVQERHWDFRLISRNNFAFDVSAGVADLAVCANRCRSSRYLSIHMNEVAPARGRRLARLIPNVNLA